MIISKKVAQKYMEKTAVEDQVVSSARFVDLAVLVVAYRAHLEHLEAAGKDRSPNTSKGLAMIKRYGDELTLGMAQVLGPLVDRPDSGSIRATLKMALRNTNTTPVAIEYWAKAIKETLPWLKTRSSIFNSLFTGKVARAARELAAVAEEESQASALNRLAAIAPVSGITASRKWIEVLAAEAGAPLSTTESVMTDAETGQNLGQDLQQVNSKLDVVTPNTPEAADLQTQKTNLVSKIEHVARKSKAPAAVLSSAATASTAPRRSTTSERFRLTPEQQEVSETMGKVVVAAGAGSGKTTCLVATIANLVENKGYAPEQIMTCSFTRAASAELALKLERDGKISGVVSGTTHRMARDIIQRNRPNLINKMRNTRGADKCFKVAMKQVEMSVAGFQQQLEAQKGVLQRIEAINGWRGIDILRSFHDQASRGRALSEKQMAVLPKFEGRGHGGYGGGYRRWAVDQEWTKLAGPPAGEGGFSDEAPEPKGFSKYWTAPVGEWFNIGKPVTSLKGEKLSAKSALLAVDNFKNSSISVDQARKEYGDNEPVVALYAAYEWLKNNDPVYGPAMDYTDQLIVALEILETDPQALASEQGRYKIIMVDEAQDLNEVQFKMFNLMGQHADLLSFIGDDKQSIYQFRGAKPENYVDLSKQPGYQTKLMTTNFRSGSEIVQAANRLIAHNGDRQIPMTCKAHEGRGAGAVSAVTAATHEDASSIAAQQIKDGIEAGESPTDFGILVRNNAELDAYTLALIVRGIPYRSLKQGQGGYFAKPVVKALTSWIRLAIGGSTAEMNDAVVEAHRTPGFGMDEMFGANLGRMARGQNYYDYIAGGGDVYFDRAAWMNKKVAEYVNAIRQVKVLGRGDSGALIRSVLDLKGPKGTFIDALMKMVDEDDVIEDEGGEGGEEAIRQAALAPVRPLMLMADNFKDPENMLAFIGKMKAANEKVEKKSPTEKDDWKEPAVLVGTVHGWKGLEAKHVFVAMSGGVFPNFRTDKTAEEQENAGVPVTAYDEERRLAYVAITRGKDTTTIMVPQKSYLGKPSGASQFIGEACIPMVGEAKEVKGLSEYEEGDEVVTLGDPGKLASAGKESTRFADDLVKSMETLETNLVGDMAI
jgi:DNA helicase-2/ATP-dependent DNA helicase PcrA